MNQGIIISKINYCTCCCLLLAFFIFSSCKNQKDKKAETITAPADTSATAKSIAELTAKINAAPGDANLLHERAKLYIRQQNFQYAMDDMKKVMSIDSSKASYLITLSDLYFAGNKTFNAKSALEKSLDLDPENLEAHMKLAEIYFIVRKYQEALLHLSAVLKKEPGNNKAFFMRGMIYKESGDTVKAISNFQTCIENDQHYYDAYMQLGVIYNARNDRLAIQYFNGALKVNPASEEALYGRGLFNQEHNELDKAIQDYTNIIQLNPKSARAHFNLGYIHYTYLKVYDQAIKHYSDAIAAYPDYVEAWYNRGLCYETVGNIIAAKADYEKALNLRPGYELALKGLGRIKQ